MKNQLRSARKLLVRKETLRTLDAFELSEVAGGQVTTTVLPTRVVCPSARICETTFTTTNP
jgi:hypothetical protein